MQTTTTDSSHPPKRAAINGLAIAGFVALILIGIMTAIYAAAFIPKTLSGLAGANVYLSSLAQPTPDATTNTQGSTPNVPISSTPSYATSSQPAPAPVTTNTPTQTTPVYTTPTYTQVPVQQNYYGLPDLVTTITSVGYLRSYGNTSSYVASSYVPEGYEGAVRFVVANRGTNVSGSWDFKASLPTTDSTSRYDSARQNSLRPGDSIVFTLGFDNVDDGTGTVRITADADHDISESNENNNVDTETISLNGNGNNNNGSNNNHDDYDSNGHYCQYGTYYSNGHYYCESSNSNNNDNSSYDTNGNYCQYGTYYSNGRYYCDSSNGNNNDSSYDSNGNYCQYGTYTSNGRTYCSSSNNNGANPNSCIYGGYYGASGQYYCNTSSNTDDYDRYYGRSCTNGSYYSNGQYYCN